MSQSTMVVAQATTTEAPAPAAAEEGAAPAGEAGHTTESTGAEGGHGGFPPMDAHSFPSQIFWLVIFFALLYLLMSKVALPRMAAVLEKRHKAIESDLSKASALKHETEAAIQHYEKSLSDARANAQGIATETRSRIAAEIEAERSALEKTLSAKLAEADSRISATKAKAMQDVHEVAAETAAEIVSELTGHKVSKEHAAKAIAGLKG
ncbi:F0F1 ATP synthase subunit B' [Aestuariivirga litoralis]|uniref:ATP synthase subunit b n=1 Tax=Aestuariivirga litoralis TaxID=2650924 RepID=A0A2W2BI50_9HYPH|nr:F0F1 ATP synthase subunit B [Aestuariivirga litoralis]PZF75587.1 F0F1 ATP synthase subunit B' [Aestuariivirga litoralis]